MVSVFVSSFLFSSEYGLSQAELLSLADLAPTELVDFYAIIEQCKDNSKALSR